MGHVLNFLCFIGTLLIALASSNPTLVNDCYVATPSAKVIKGSNHVTGRKGTPLYQLALHKQTDNTGLTKGMPGYEVRLTINESMRNFREAYVSIEEVSDTDCGPGELTFESKDYELRSKEGTDCPTLISTQSKSAMTGLPSLIWKPPKCGCVQIRALVRDDAMTYGEETSVSTGPLAKLACVQEAEKSRHFDALCSVIDDYVAGSILSRGSFLQRHHLQVAWMDRYNLEMAIELRRADSKICCNEKDDDSRQQCFENVQLRRIDAFCGESEPDIPFSTFRDKHMRHLGRRCCAILGPRRYNCFRADNTTVHADYRPLEFSMDETDPVNDLAVFADDHFDLTALTPIEFGPGILPIQQPLPSLHSQQELVPQELEETDDEEDEEEDDEDNDDDEDDDGEEDEKDEEEVEEETDDSIESETTGMTGLRSEKDFGETVKTTKPKPVSPKNEKRPAKSEKITTGLLGVIAKSSGKVASTKKSTTRSQRFPPTEKNQSQHVPDPLDDVTTPVDPIDAVYPSETETQISPSSRRRKGENFRQELGAKSARRTGRGSRRGQGRRSGRKGGSKRRMRIRIDDRQSRNGNPLMDGQRNSRSKDRAFLSGRNSRLTGDDTSSGFGQWYVSRGCCKEGMGEGQHIVGHVQDAQRQCKTGAAKTLEVLPIKWGFDVQEKCWASFVRCCMQRAVRGLEMTSAEFRESYTYEKPGPTAHSDPVREEVDMDTTDPVHDLPGEVRHRSMRQRPARQEYEEEEDEEVGEEEFSGPNRFDDLDNGMDEEDEQLMRGALDREAPRGGRLSRPTHSRDFVDDDEEEDGSDEDEEEAFVKEFDLQIDPRGLEPTELDRREGVTNRKSSQVPKIDPNEFDPLGLDLRPRSSKKDRKESSTRQRSRMMDSMDSMRETSRFDKADVDEDIFNTIASRRAWRRASRRGGRSRSGRRSRRKSKRGRSSRRGLRHRQSDEAYQVIRPRDFTHDAMDSREMANTFHHHQRRLDLDSKELRDMYSQNRKHNRRGRQSRRSRTNGFRV